MSTFRFPDPIIARPVRHERPITHLFNTAKLRALAKTAGERIALRALANDICEKKPHIPDGELANTLRILALRARDIEKVFEQERTA